MATAIQPTDQRSGVRPISFVLQRGLVFGKQVTLNIRPTDLTRAEPNRATVRQTLGRTVQGWLDDFGPGMPTVTIAGHTGWRAGRYDGRDGVAAFHELNDLIQRDYPEAKQAAIDTGIDPATVKLIFVDMLDGFSYVVSPSSFVLQRSRSQPLLMKYNIQMQAIDTELDSPIVSLPVLGTFSSGMRALESAISGLSGIAGQVQGFVGRVLPTDQLHVASTVGNFVDRSLLVFQGVVNDLSNNGIVGNVTSSVGDLIARVGQSVFRTLSSYGIDPSVIKFLADVGGHYSEIVCIFSNALRPRETYEDYDGLFGASNCSSTTGGRAASAYIALNALGLTVPAKQLISLTTDAIASANRLVGSDPVLGPVIAPEIDRHLNTITRDLRIDLSLLQ